MHPHQIVLDTRSVQYEYHKNGEFSLVSRTDNPRRLSCYQTNFLNRTWMIHEWHHIIGLSLPRGKNLDWLVQKYNYQY